MESVDWDDLTTSGLTGTVYVYDNNKSGGAGYIEWNGTAGSLTGGIIAPYQGFWVKGSGGSGSLTFETADQENIGGHFYKEKTGQFMSFKVEGESFMIPGSVIYPNTNLPTVFGGGSGQFSLEPDWDGMAEHSALGVSGEDLKEMFG